MIKTHSILRSFLMVLYSLCAHIAISVSLLCFFEALNTSHYYPAISLGSILRSDTPFLFFFAAFLVITLLGTIIFAFSKNKAELVTSFVKTFIPTVFWSDLLFFLWIFLFDH
jgi:hypothetical protein